MLAYGSHQTWGIHMQLGMIGLGRMGAHVARRLIRAGHGLHVYTTRTLEVEAVEAKGIKGSTCLDAFVSGLTSPRAILLMVPAAAVDPLLFGLTPLLEPGDIVIDGGDSYYRDDLRRADALRLKGLHYVDVGVSGGVWGLERGYCPMIGGEAAVVERLDPIFRSLASGGETSSCTPRASGEPTRTEQGYLHCGPNGAGHFVKMVHSRIECGLMAALAESSGILKKADAGRAAAVFDAETTPLRNPQLYK
jgi:6-phosphogluconate dehydrogenase